mmetsp:Transcript_56244/g.180562  ORF Transcript_56244/g.180562 Transcript_56244/m.180562 type:complete len:122 (-) Transcript_56244:139-504(-)
MSGICGHLKQLEVFCNGCRNECDQKCVIDNHEVEILQTPGFEMPNCSEHAFCPSGRTATDLCTPRQRAGYYTDGALGRPGSAPFRTRTASGLGLAQLPGGLASERSHASTPGRYGGGIHVA